MAVKSVDVCEGDKPNGQNNGRTIGKIASGREMNQGRRGIIV